MRSLKFLLHCGVDPGGRGSHRVPTAPRLVSREPATQCPVPPRSASRRLSWAWPRPGRPMGTAAEGGAPRGEMGGAARGSGAFSPAAVRVGSRRAGAQVAGLEEVAAAG